MVDNNLIYNAENDEPNDLCMINTEDLLNLSSSQGFLENFENFSDLNTLPEHFDKFPNMVPIQTEYAFDMHVEPGDNQNWLYSSNMSKVFIKLNSVMNVNVTYRPQNPSKKLFVRAMILFTNPDDMHLQVKRCANHRMSNENQEVPQSHILKCCAPNTQYIGHEEQQVFGQRLSILVPLGRPNIDEDGKTTEKLGLEFLCQNSCTTGINRKSTAVVFTLETEQQDIVGKSVMSFKVCSCPKRDMAREDPSYNHSRKRDPNTVPHGKRPSKMVCLPEVKLEPPTPSPDVSFEQTFEQPYTVTLTMPNKASMQHVLRCAFNEVTATMAKDKSANPSKYLKYAKTIEKLLEAHSE